MNNEMLAIARLIEKAHQVILIIEDREVFLSVDIQKEIVAAIRLANR